MALTVLALCAGVGGLELGVGRVVRTRVLGYVEWDAYAAAVLLARMEDSALGPAPVWCGELASFDASLFAGVDLVTAGFPCQPFSVAGKRLGTDDERWLWPEIARIVRDVGPGLVFLENVSGLVPHGLGTVLGDLAELGFDADWDLFRASDVEAPHRRERWFCLAHARGVELRQAADGGIASNESRSRSARALPDAERMFLRPEQGRLESRRPGAAESGVVGEGVGNPNRARENTGAEAGGSREATRESGGWPSRWPPGPDGDWSSVPPEAQPAIRGVAHGLHARVDRLRCLGNAVVPDQAALAFRVLSGRLGLTPTSRESHSEPRQRVL